MRLDVLLTPGELVPSEIAERTVVVLDVLRASTTIVEALASGARSLFPWPIEEAIGLAGRWDATRWCWPASAGAAHRRLRPGQLAGRLHPARVAARSW
jgi:hypothetical protein